MKLVCTQSRVKDFTVGKIYHDNKRGAGRKVAGNEHDNWILNGGGLSVHGGVKSDPYATFKEVPAKSLMKMLVRAYVNYAKSRGWGDSKNGAFKSWSKTPYTGVKDWARCFAIGDDQKAIRQDAEAEGQLIDQEFINWYVEEQMSYY